jgi:hypothetical protein
MSTAVKAKCEHCGSVRLERLISRVVVPRPKRSLDSFDESMLNDVDEQDPKSMARFAKRMRDEMGEDMGPELDEAIDQMEQGNFPDEAGDDFGMDD